MNPGQTNLHALMAERAALGIFIKLGRREVIEIVAQAGFDFAICDLEHSQITEKEAASVILAANRAGLPLIVRLTHLDAGHINRLLEAGANGIQLPHLQEHGEVDTFRGAAKYAPSGSRSISLAQPAAGYGSEPLTEYMKRANEEVLLVGQLESREMERPLERLVQGLDVAFIGLLDLSVDMGIPGRLDDPLMLELIAEIEQAARAAKVNLGVYADSPARATQAIRAGYRFIALSSDLGALAGATKGWIKELQAAISRKA